MEQFKGRNIPIRNIPILELMDVMDESKMENVCDP